MKVGSRTFGVIGIWDSLPFPWAPGQYGYRHGPVNARVSRQSRRVIRGSQPDMPWMGLIPTQAHGSVRGPMPATLALGTFEREMTRQCRRFGMAGRWPSAKELGGVVGASQRVLTDRADAVRHQGGGADRPGTRSRNARGASTWRGVPSGAGSLLNERRTRRAFPPGGLPICPVR